MLAGRPPLRPGRHPLATYCAIHPGAWGATRLSPAEAAAATLPTVLHADDASKQLRQLGRLSSRVDGFGLWWDSEPELISVVLKALPDDCPDAESTIAPTNAQDRG